MFFFTISLLRAKLHGTNSNQEIRIQLKTLKLFWEARGQDLRTPQNMIPRRLYIEVPGTMAVAVVYKQVRCGKMRSGKVSKEGNVRTTPGFG